VTIRWLPLLCDDNNAALLPPILMVQFASGSLQENFDCQGHQNLHVQYVQRPVSLQACRFSQGTQFRYSKRYTYVLYQDAWYRTHMKQYEHTMQNQHARYSNDSVHEKMTQSTHLVLQNEPTWRRISLIGVVGTLSTGTCRGSALTNAGSLSPAMGKLKMTDVAPEVMLMDADMPSSRRTSGCSALGMLKASCMREH
jgi:hypothetical protein